MYSVTTRTAAEFSPIGSGRNVLCTPPAAAMSCSSHEADDAESRDRVTGKIPPTPSASETNDSRFWMVNGGASASRWTTRKPSSDFPEKIGVDIVDPRPVCRSPGRSVGVTGMSPCAAIGPHTALSVANKPAPSRASRTPRNGRPFSGRNRSASATCGHIIAITTASLCASSEGDAGSPSAAMACPTELDPGVSSAFDASTRIGAVRLIVLMTNHHKEYFKILSLTTLDHRKMYFG